MAAIIGVTHNENGPTSGGTIAATRVVKDGNGVIVLITHDTAGNTVNGASSISDGSVVNATPDATFNSVTIGQMVRAFSYLNHVGGSFTFTVTFPASVVARGIYVIEVEGLAQFDTSANLDNAGSTTPNAGPITPAQDGSIIVGYTVDGAAPTLVGGSPFTEYVSDPTQIGCELAAFIQSQKAAVSGSWNLSPSAGWMAMVLAYRPKSRKQTRNLAPQQRMI